MTDTTTTAPVAAIERRLEFRASPERVWRAISDSDELARWFSQRADMPIEVGGVGWLEWDGHGRSVVRVEVVDPPHRLVWRWMNGPSSEADDTATLVEWRLEPTAGGGTILHLRESGFARPSSRADNAVGWLTELAELVDLLAVERWEHGIRRTYAFRAAPERVWAAFADPEQFARWFGGETPPALGAGTDGWFVWPAHGRFAIRVEVVEPPVYLAWRWTTQQDTRSMPRTRSCGPSGRSSVARTAGPTSICSRPGSSDRTSSTRTRAAGTGTSSRRCDAYLAKRRRAPDTRPPRVQRSTPAPVAGSAATGSAVLVADSVASART